MASFYRPGFRVSHCVKDPKLLFGWNAPGMLLDVAVGKIEAGESFMVRGERRSGKTSFLSCLKARVYEECPRVTVASVDFSCVSDITDAGAAHKYILEKVLRALWEDERISWISDPLDLDKYRFTRSALDKSLAQLDGECSTQSCLSMLDRLLKRHDHRLFIFFDEYESMYRAFGGGSSYFNLYRELQQHSEKGGISCIIAGAESTSSFSGRTGSPQFNILEPIHIGAITRDAFHALWQHCLEDCSPQCRERVQEKMATIEGGIDGIYALCGGRPAYAKALGAFWTELGDGTPPRLIQWFKDILNRLSLCDNNSKAVLFTIARERSLNRLNVARKNEILDDLKNLGLIRENREDPTGLPWVINGELWRNFLISRYEDEINSGDLSVASAHEHHSAHSEETRNIKEITDGHSLARWFLGHRDFSTTIVQDYRETDWLEFKRAFYWDAESVKTGEDKEYFYGLCRGCKRRPNVKGHENCWSNCKARNEVNWKVSEAVIAIANSGGGVLLLGIDDNLPDVGYIPASLREGVRDKEEFVRDRLRPGILPEDGEWHISSNWRWRIAEESLGDYRVWRDSVHFDEKKAADGSLYAAIFIAPHPDKLLLVQELKEQNSTTICLGRAVGEGRVTRYDTLEKREKFKSRRASTFTCTYYRDEAYKILNEYFESTA